MIFRGGTTQSQCTTQAKQKRNNCSCQRPGETLEGVAVRHSCHSTNSQDTKVRRNHSLVMGVDCGHAPESAAKREISAGC